MAEWNARFRPQEVNGEKKTGPWDWAGSCKVS